MWGRLRPVLMNDSCRACGQAFQHIKSGARHGTAAVRKNPDIGFGTGSVAEALQGDLREMIDDESSADLRTGEASAFRRVVGDRLFQSLLARLGLCDGEAMRRTRRIGLRIVRTGAGADVAARIGPVDMAVIETYGRRVAVVMVRHECHRLHQHAEQQYGLREPVVSQVPHLPQKYAFFPNMEIPGVFCMVGSCGQPYSPSVRNRVEQATSFFPGLCGSVAPGTEAEAETGKSPVRMRSGGGEEWKVACRGGSGNRAGGSARCGK